VIFDFSLGGTFISGKIKIYDDRFDMILKIPILVMIYKGKIIEELNTHIPKYFGEQR
jgi:hypothetical protein